MKILVAGGSGFIGRAVSAALVAEGHAVVVAARHASAAGLPPECTTVDLDVSSDDLGHPALADIEAVVNLVGISHPRGKNTFERAHVVAVRRLVEHCRERGIARLVHVSVVRVAGARGTYQESKARGEGVVEGSGLDWTIIRPALVYGSGDAMVRALVELIRISAVFPVPGGPPGMLQVVDVRDVAQAVARCIDRPTTHRRFYDVVGPEKFTLADLVTHVSAALEVRTWTPAVPPSAMRLGATVAELALPHPIVTRAQLGMLIAGLHGDPEPARRDLGIDARRLSRERLRELAAEIEVRIPSLRLVPDRRRAESLAANEPATKPLRWLLPILMTLMLALPWVIEHLWLRMGVVNTVMAAITLWVVRLDHRRLWRFDALRVLLGLGLGVVMFGVAQLVLGLLGALAPGMVADGASFVAAAGTLPAAAGIVALVAICAAEDAVWRSAVTLPLAGRLGAWRGATAAGVLFGAAHLTSGPPILVLAAVVAGFVWSTIAIRTRSLVVTVACHATWDLLMIAMGI